MAARVVVCRSEIGDVYALAARLRPGDRGEAQAMGFDPRLGIRKSFRHAILRKSYFVDGELAAMSGLCGAMISDIGQPYLMTSAAVERVKVTFVRMVRQGAAEMLLHRRRLDGYVAADYAGACRLLEAIGFQLGDPEPIGSHGALFRKFVLSSEAERLASLAAEGARAQCGHPIVAARGE